MEEILDNNLGEKISLDYNMKFLPLKKHAGHCKIHFYRN